MGRIKIGNIKGPQGEAGKDFEYAKTYASVSAMNADYSGTDVEVGEYVIIDSGNNDADNGKVYRKGSNAYTYEHNIAGPTGPRGATGPMPTLYNGLDVTTPGLGALDAAVGPTIANKVSASGGEAGDTVASFTSADSTTDSDITAFTAMEKLTSGSALKTLMNVVSKAVRNVRWLKKKADAADTSISSLNDALANIMFAGEAKKVRFANNSTNTDISIRTLHDDGSASGFSATSQGIALQTFPASGNASNVLKVNFLHTTTTANGTSATTATLIPGLVNYTHRKLIATCNGGANGGRSIISAIPTGANTVTINWDGNTPASGDIQISLMYWE